MHDVSVCVDHSLPDATQVSQVEDVVELGRSRQHLYLIVEHRMLYEANRLILYASFSHSNTKNELTPSLLLSTLNAFPLSEISKKTATRC